MNMAAEERATYRLKYHETRRAALGLEAIAKAEYKSGAFEKYRMGYSYAPEEDGKTLRITSVVDDSPAEKAGLVVGDLLISKDGVLLNAENDSGELVLYDTPGTKYRLRVRRGHRTHTVTLVADMPIVLSMLDTDIDGSFDGFYSSDYVYVTNVSGRDLTNTLLFVDIIGKHGADARQATDAHVHFILSWPAGNTRVLRYMSTSASGIASDQSVDQIDSLAFRIYSDQFTQSETHTYTEDRFSQDVQRYLKGKHFTMKWHSYPDGHLLYYSGVTIKTVDGSSFPATSLELTVQSRSGSKSFKYDIANDVFDGNEYFSHPDLNGMSPTRIDFSFNLPYTKHTVDKYVQY